MFSMQANVSPQGAGTLAALYGLLFLPTMVSSANNVTNIYSVFARADSNANYTGTVTNYNAIVAGAIGAAGGAQWGSATSPTNVYQFTAQDAIATTNVYGLRSLISAGANKYNIYASGTANNYMAGALGIGTTSPTSQLHVAGNTFITGSVGVGTSVSATATVAVSKDITGGTSSTGIIQNGTVQSGVTTAARGFYNTLNIANNSTFTINNVYHYATINSRPSALNTTISNLHGYFVDSGLVAGVVNYGFTGTLPASSAFTITNVSLTTNIVTVTTSAAHNFAPGQTVVVAATTTTSINGSFTILTSPSTTTFTYALVLGDIVSTADTGTSTVSINRWNAYMTGTAPNYFLGQVTIGTTNLTNGYLAVAGTQSGATSMLYVGGTNQYTGTTPIGIYCNPTLTGTSSMTATYGINLVPSGTLAAGASVGTYGGININPALNSATTPTSYYGAIGRLDFNAAALGGTVTTAATYLASAPAFNAATTTNITTYIGFRAAGAANGTNQSITNIFAFQGLQNTTASSNAYNLYMSGTAKNYLAGNTGIGNTNPNATLAVTGTANVSGAVAFASTFAAGDTTITGFANVSVSVNSALITVGTSFIANTTGAYHTGTVNAASHTVGSNFIANTNGVTTTGFANIATTLAAGNTTVTGFVNATSTIQGGSSLTIAGAASGITTLAAGNTTITGFANVSSTLQVGANVTIATTAALIANASPGTAGQLLASNASAIYWTSSIGSYYKGNQGTVGLAADAANIFRINSNTVSTNITFLAGENASAAGPITVGTGFTITVSTGARMVIV